MASRPKGQAVTATLLSPTRSPPGESLLQRRYRELFREHLSQTLATLFAEFTGLHFHIAWAQPPSTGLDVQNLPTACSVCCRLSGSRLRPECQVCGPHHLSAALESKHGHRFTCHLGVRNYWVPIRIRSRTLGTAYLQALEHPITQPPVGHYPGSIPQARRRPVGAMVVSRVQFARAARFLWHIVEHVQTASLSDLRKADLSSAGRALLALEREQARLHETLHRHLPAAPEAPRSSGPESRAQQVVHSLLERIELDFGNAITLQQLARELQMNAAYLSALFSRSVGLPFKAYLTELRLQKAKEMLGDPTRTASEVALAVGYSSEDRFRFAFKRATGLSPRVWRETMETAVAGRGGGQISSYFFA